MENSTHKEQSLGISLSESISFGKYLNILNRNKWKILNFTFAITLLTAIFVFSLKPIYIATATLVIESQPRKFVSIEDVYGVDTRNTEYYATQFEILRSRELAERVIEKLELEKNSEFISGQSMWSSAKELLSINPEMEMSAEKSEKNASADRIRLVDEFLKRLSIDPIRKTQLVEISFEAHDPMVGASIPNALADAYVDYYLDARMKMTQQATTWLTQRMQALKITLNDAEKRLQAFREQERVLDLQSVRTLASKSLEDLSAKLGEARERKAKAESLFNQVKILQGESSEILESVPAILNHATIQNIKSEESKAESKLAEFAKRYGAQHPKMLSAQSELDSIREKLKRQIRVVVSALEKEYDVARVNENQLSRSLNRTKEEIQNINRKEFQLRELEQDVETNRKLYDTFFTRYQETSATEDINTANARIVDPAIAPLEPAKPKKAQAIASAFFISLLLAIFTAIFREKSNDSIKTSEDVEEKLGQPFLGTLPLANLPRGQTLNPLQIFRASEYAALAESMRTIRTSLLLTGLDKPQKITLVTSSVPGEGKSTLAACLAIALGQLKQRVLLIDADMRHPSMLKLFNIAENTPGLSNVVAGTDSFEECVQHQEGFLELNPSENEPDNPVEALTLKLQQSIYRQEAGIDVLPSGFTPPNPLELLSSERFNMVLQELSKKYDRIIIDSPPIQAVSDPLVIAKCVHSTIYVVKADATRYRFVRTGIKRLRESGTTITGVVLNHFDVNKAAKYGNYNYYQGEYYGKYVSTQTDKKQIINPFKFKTVAERT